MSGIFKAYDVRGVYGSELTEKDAYMIAYYFVKFTGLRKLKVSFDARESSEVLCIYFMRGLIDARCEPFCQGVSSTPCFYYSLFDGVNSGVMITASHNSKEYNGFKFMLGLESFDSRNGLLDVEKLVCEDLDDLNSGYARVEEELKGVKLDDFIRQNGIDYSSKLNSYIAFLERYYKKILNSKERDVLRNLNLVFDFSSGVSSLALVPFFEKIGLDFVALNEKPDGSFPVHKPDPKEAKEYLKSRDDLKADCFMVFDGDGDRVLFYDEKRNQVLPDYPIALLIDYFITKGSHFVVDLRISRVVSDMCKDRGALLELLRVGRSFYQDFMKKNDCVFGAELSGHLFFRDFKYLDNPDFAVIHMLKIFAREILDKGEKFVFSKMLERYKKYYKLPEESLVVNDSSRVLEAIKKKYKKSLISEVDGYSFDAGEYWFNVRRSNTEPRMRVSFEGLHEKKTKDEFNNLIEFIKGV